MDYNVFNLGLSLLILTIINIVLGSITSIFNQQFDKIKFIKGIIKALIVVLSFVGVIYVGSLNENILMVNVDGNQVNLSNATYLLMMSGYLYYGKEVLVKLSSFVSGKYKIDENKEVE